MELLTGIKPRKYQETILKTCIDKNCLVVLPTGLGKTLIALLLAVERMKAFPGEKVVFLAPTKPLAEQHLDYFKKNLPELFGEMQLFTGSVSAPKRKKIWQTTDIVFSTPQCVANDLKNNLYDLSEVCLLVEDEAHRCIKNYDYNYIAQKYKQQGTNQRIVGMTASPGSDERKIKDICRNLSIEALELRTRDHEEVKPYLQELTFEKVFVEFPEEFQRIKNALSALFLEYVEGLRGRRLLWGPPTKTALIALQKKIMLSISRGNKNFNNLLGVSACAQAIKIQHALELLETQTQESFNKYLRGLFKQAKEKKNKGVVKLVSKTLFNKAFMDSNELIAKEIEHPKIQKLFEIVKEEQAKNPKTKTIIFSQFRDTARSISRRLNEISHVRAKVFVGQTKKKTVGVGKRKGIEETTGLSQKEQKTVITDFAQGKINILCATSIGEEGLDIPEVNTVIFYEPVPSAIRAIQRAGRTARLMEGKLIMLITKKTRDETYFYASKAKEKRMHSAIQNIKEDMHNKKFNARDVQRKL